jgi:hypothetical protein
LRYVYHSVITDDCCAFPLIYHDTVTESRFTGVFEAWNPNNQSILTLEYSRMLNNTAQYTLILIDPISNTQDTLLEQYFYRFFQTINFNYDGSLILYVVNNIDFETRQLMTFDMETREEIALPLFGSNPQWVNGGR